MRCSRSSRRQGVACRAFTLLEVVVGLTLMATMLTSSLLAFSAHRKQRRFADAKLTAVAIADNLLDFMSGSPDGIPPVGRGPIAGNPNWYWQTSPIGVLAPALIPMRVIRFQIVDASWDNQGRVLLSIDLVEPLEAG